MFLDEFVIFFGATVLNFFLTFYFMLTDNFYSPQGPPGGGGPPGTPIMPSPAGTEIYLEITKL